jgi:hypothetical protein
MIPGCVLILASLCLPAPYDRATDLRASWAVSDGRTGVAQADVVARLGVRITAVQSDNLRPRQISGLARACNGRTCLLYLRTCTPSGLRCEWDWGVAPTAKAPGFYTREVLIDAASPAAMTRAVAALSINPETGAPAVPLAAMNVTAALPYRPPCNGPQTASCDVSYDRIPYVGDP